MCRRRECCGEKQEDGEDLLGGAHGGGDVDARGLVCCSNCRVRLRGRHKVDGGGGNGSVLKAFEGGEDRVVLQCFNG